MTTVVTIRMDEEGELTYVFANGLTQWERHSLATKIRITSRDLIYDILGETPIQQAFPPIPLTVEETPADILALTSVLLEQGNLVSQEPELSV